MCNVQNILFSQMHNMEQLRSVKFKFYIGSYHNNLSILCTLKMRTLDSCLNGLIS